MKTDSAIPDPLHPQVALLGESVLVNVHRIYQCQGRACVIHNPSEHHMREWPLTWRDDKGVMERQCPHGVDHPDPDDAAYLTSHGRWEWTVHGCDGCCSRDD